MAAFKRRATTPPEAEAAGDAEANAPLKEPVFMAQSDGTRTAQYVRYVKALNNQFTSWVQRQLQEHPMELWQDGVQDYLRHASKINEDFKDVISSPVEASASLPRSESAQPQSMSLFSNQQVNEGFTAKFPVKPLFEIKGGVNFSQPFPSLVIPSATKPFSGESLVTATAVPSNGTDTHDTQEDDETPQEPSSPSVKRMDEPGVQILHEIKCKLYIKGDASTDGAWKEMGIGNLTLRAKEGAEKGSKEAKATVLVRNEVGRVLLNALLYPNMKLNIQKNTVSGIFHSAEADIKIHGAASPEAKAGKGRLYLFRVKTPSDAENLVEVLTSNAPKG
ncbi:hypothetical protein KP509_25G032000 [Ceratopteris richardii]|uniref:RanBD1 domain-containing protein n=1 Tax=Ceratopteris richardii TaxID=49495 RepID=A0A8T2RQH6_CERRI|nr:hypothetical protein KP509_25G032000 [Ceratopteris richardii]KAH7298203.1 hypothetical protein KP509_25G032000 [Ceratopteris richardii]KAH7298204.1 hypothetical protein KP509_25G032000 [Ceratopteris richardii]